MVLIAPPPPGRPPHPRFFELSPGTGLVRLFDPTSYGASATGFRFYGPLKRFDHHTGDGPDRAPVVDSVRGIYYAALTLAGCIVEVFGDAGSITPGNWHVARPRTTRALLLLDLRGSGAMRAGSVAALAKMADQSLSQMWSRYFYENPPIYSAIDGAVYYNAHNDDEAIVLYERASAALICLNNQILQFDEPALRPLVIDIALANNLDFL